MSHTHCLICESENLCKLKSYPINRLLKCTNCGFVFCEQIPNEQELKVHYSSYSRDDYLSPITIKRYHELLDDFEKYRKNNALLDVGCGIGYFLTEAKNRGWKVYGTEYTPEAIAICAGKGIEMKSGKLHKEMFPGISFDVVTSFEVLEHINTPQQELENIYGLLRTGGVFYFTTPNFNSLLRYVLKEKYNVICYPEHLSYYTPKTMHRLLAAKGFKKKRLQTTGISITRLFTSLKIRRTQNKEGNQFISPTTHDEKIRKWTERNIFFKVVKNAVNFMVSLFGVGDNIKGYYEKAKLE